MNHIRRLPPDRIEAAYAAWPGPDQDKTVQKALLLRLRIEAVARSLPSTVIVGVARADRVRQRLMLAVGEPGLDGPRRARRISVQVATEAPSPTGSVKD